MRTNKKSNGFVLWEGPSLIDGNPIVVIVTGINTASRNIKTGDMLQSHILVRNTNPIEALLQEQDYSICGNCPLRRKICYVDLRGTGQVWAKYKRGGYPQLNDNILQIIKYQQEYLRLGTYGDPAATPLKVWEPLINHVSGYTGYTHQWANCEPGWKSLLMSSVESIPLKQQANSMGWRTYRILSKGEAPLEDEILCKNYLDTHIHCEQCLLCNGGKGKNIAVPVHGWGSKVNNFHLMQTSMKGG
ncbi:hypothetical protein FD723_40210 (plasmid) [Nostoc sp. C052]|uniref:hypothetical protein n=1 Tax=Nostoc sp. C052 TaxID=2576902 RepID=UPI0015C33643|nr:hypothetical protein [Nostoc sp. C052]QLE46438.1 hypothetical protein FD723_40210 [Nostoc sp. C052]